MDTDQTRPIQRRIYLEMTVVRQELCELQGRIESSRRLGAIWLAVVLCGSLVLQACAGGDGAPAVFSSYQNRSGDLTMLPSVPPSDIQTTVTDAMITDETEPTTTFLPLLLRSFRPEDPLLGIALEGFYDEAGLQEALKLGARWGRRWTEVSWRDVEPQEGDYRWAELAQLEDELLQARAVGLEPILEIQLSPTWAQKHPPHACGPIRADKFDAFAAFMEQMVKRYGTGTRYGVRYWQLGNEPDLAIGIVDPDSLYGCWGDLNDSYYGGGHYAEMLKVVYPRIKAADAGAVVMMAGLLLECDPYTMVVGIDCSNEERFKSGLFLEGIMRAGGGDYFDMADVHSYGELRMDIPARMSSIYEWSGREGGTGLPEKVEFVRKVMAKYGHPDKPVFAGEVALKCDRFNVATCDEQVFGDVGAAFVPRVYAEAYGLNISGATYYALIAPPKGLLRPDFTPRQPYHAFVFLSSQIRDTEYVGEVTQYSQEVNGHMFNKRGASQIQILWSRDGTTQMIAVPPDFVQAYDKYGRGLDADNGQLAVDWSPIYVELGNLNN